MSREVFTVGALLRRPFRRALDAAEIVYREDKGLLDSQFIVIGSDAEVDAVREWAASVQRNISQ